MATTFINEVKLGEGGFGEVWRCRRKEDGQPFAKKILIAGTDADAVKRFVKEVRLLGSLDHPNIVKVEAVRLNSAPYCYWMPLYAHSLDDALDDIVGAEERIRPIFSAILDAIEYAHSQGVLHRDLKPQNVLMNSDSDLVVSDFGLGRHIDAASTRLTETGMRGGTPLYRAPEQFTDFKRADARSDVYSLGRMLYEMYSGRLGMGIQDLSTLPSGIRVLVSKCTKGDPGHRYQSVTSLKQAWNALFDAVARNTQNEMSFQLRVRDWLSEEEAGQLLRSLEEHSRDNDDALHEFLIKCTTGAVLAMHRADAEGVRQLIRRFSQFTAESGWGWDYTALPDRRRLFRDSF